MKFADITNLLEKLGIKIPETFWKEEIVRFITESRSERIVEIPLVLNYIPQKQSKILDIGCRYSLLPIQLASLGHEVYGIDIYPYKRRHPNLRFFRKDFRQSPFKDNFFDVVISLSTIEHIGLGFYKEARNPEGDKEALEETRRVLKPEGTLLLTVPFGQPIDSGWYKVYDRKRISKLLSAFNVSVIKVFAEMNGIWQPLSINKAEKMDSTGRVKAVIFISAKKK